MPGTILNRIFSNRRLKSIASDQAQGQAQGQELLLPTISRVTTAPLPCDKEHSTHNYAAHEQRAPRSTMTEPRNGKRSTSISRSTSATRRASYDSVREQSDVPQSFSKYTREARSKALESAVSSDDDATPTPDGQKPLAGSIKRTELRGRRKSNSCSQLPRLAWNSPPTLAVADDDEVVLHKEVQGRQLAAFEALPTEIMEDIMKLLVIDTSMNEYASRYEDIASCLRVSRQINRVATSVLYQYISISHSKIFSKFMSRMMPDPELATVVKRLDFSRYTNIGFNRSKQASSEILNVTPQTLKQCLELTTNLREFLVHEHIDDELDCSVIAKLFSMPTVQGLDFCACASQIFTEQFSYYTSCMVLANSPFPQLKRLSLHECSTLQSPVFEALLPQLLNLTHLDVAHTLVTDEALFAIPRDARITHLNLGRCTRITGAAVVRFLTTHPAVKDSLVFLNLMADPTRYRLLSEEELSFLLPRLPTTLRSLNIGGARINSSHIPLLLPLTRYIEELGLSGADLSIDEINSLFANDEKSRNTASSAVRYVDLSCVASVTQPNLHFSANPLTGLKTAPLEVIELSESVLEQLKKRNKSAKNPEWVVRELGRRGWYVRKPNVHGGLVDDGTRSWKMGARWWGMRKVPVAEQEVGGMYGFYAFKRI